MKHVRGEHAWIALAILVVGYDALAQDGELLSEAVDRFIEKHPTATRLIVAGVAAHLTNLIPPQIDPLHRLAVTTRTYRTRRIAQERATLQVVDITTFKRRRHGGQASEA